MSFWPKFILREIAGYCTYSDFANLLVTCKTYYHHRHFLAKTKFQPTDYKAVYEYVKDIINTIYKECGAERSLLTTTSDYYGKVRHITQLKKQFVLSKCIRRLEGICVVATRWSPTDIVERTHDDRHVALTIDMMTKFFNECLSGYNMIVTCKFQSSLHGYMAQNSPILLLNLDRVRIRRKSTSNKIVLLVLCCLVLCWLVKNNTK